MVCCVSATNKGAFLGQYFQKEKNRKLLEAVCNITMSFRWQGIGRARTSTYGGSEILDFLETLFFYGEEGQVTWHNVNA
jgi:hypothetical protein